MAGLVRKVIKLTSHQIHWSLFFTYMEVGMEHQQSGWGLSESWLGSLGPWIKSSQKVKNLKSHIHVLTLNALTSQSTEICRSQFIPLGYHRSHRSWKRGKRIWLTIYNSIKNSCSVFIVMYMYCKKCIFKTINIIFPTSKALWDHIVIVQRFSSNVNFSISSISLTGNKFSLIKYSV